MKTIKENRFETTNGNFLVAPKIGNFSYYMSKRGKVLRVCSFDEREYAETWGVFPRIYEYVDRINSIENRLFAQLFELCKGLFEGFDVPVGDFPSQSDVWKGRFVDYLKSTLDDAFPDMIKDIVPTGKRSMEITIDLGLGYEISKRGYLY